MKKILFGLGVYFWISAFVSLSWAGWPYNYSKEYEIPGYYVLYKITDYNPAEQVNKKAFSRMMYAMCSLHGYESMQLAIYDSGQKEGDGVRAYGTTGDGPFPRVYISTNKETAKLLEEKIGFWIHFEEVYDYFRNDGPVWSKLLTDKPLVLLVMATEIKSSEVTTDKTCFDIPKDKYSENVIRLCYDKANPLLATINTNDDFFFQDSRVFFQAYRDNLIIFDVR